MTDLDANFERGNALRNSALGEPGVRRKALLDALSPDIMRYAIGFVWGDVLQRPGLDQKTRELITLAIAMGLGRSREVRNHTRGFLNHGGTREEVIELLIQVAAYAGFPTMIDAAYGVIDVLEELGQFQRPAGAEGAAG
jgi:4-carboxymuconolactone decarboxylase